MIRKLRIKLVTAAMLSLLAVLTIIIGAASLFNYHGIVSSTDSVLNLLAQNNGSFPKMFFGIQPDTVPESLPEVVLESFPDGMSENRAENAPDVGMENNFAPDSFRGHQFSEELPYESRYFVVSFNAAGNLLSTNTGKIAAVDSQSAIDYAQDVLDRGKIKGFIGNYRYMVSKTDSQTQVIFLYCQRELRSFQSFVFVSVIMALAGSAAVFLMLIFLSGRIVKPFSENYEKQKRFITDAGHELKTPLAIINADTEILEMDFGEDNEWIHDIQTQTERLSDLTNSLVFLARMEENRPQEMSEFSLSATAKETVESFQALAKTHHKNLDAAIGSGIFMNGDEKTIRRLITIFLDNAMKYSNENGKIELSLEKSKKAITLCVYNTTDFISKESIGHLFDRFYRADESRNSKTGGYGLGLSIALAIVNTHKGKISASTEDEKSLKITVTFPAS